MRLEVDLQGVLSSITFPALLALERFQVEVFGLVVSFEILFGLITGAATQASEWLRRRIVAPHVSAKITFG